MRYVQKVFDMVKGIEVKFGKKKRERWDHDKEEKAGTSLGVQGPRASI
jgi:hypothetical protein